MFRAKLLGLLGLLLLAVPAIVQAQGVLIVTDPDQIVRLPRPIIIVQPERPRPTPPASSYSIKELAVQANVVDQVARVNVAQTFVNTGSTQMEVCFVFPLPYDGAVEQLTLLVDGKEFAAKLLPAAEARAMYEAIVRKNQDPALLEWVGTGMFKTSVFPVPAGAERTVTLRYSQLLRKDHSLTDFLFPLSTARYTTNPVEKLNVRVSIESSAEIKNVYSPTHAVEIQRADSRHATVLLSRTNEIPSSDFRLFFDVNEGPLGASVLSYRPDENDEGYFLLLASPQIKAPDAERQSKTVMFVLDRSGSMSGKKIEQAREALKFVLNNLHEGDMFNIVVYDSAVESFRPELQKYDQETRSAALGYVDGIYAGGSTNISGALATALGQLQDSSRPNYVLFLTDGLPTAGETNEAQIVAGARGQNKVNARMINFGVGYDVNSRLLDRLSRAHRGQSEYVRPDEDLEAHVSRLYAKIASPVMTDVGIKIELDAPQSEGSPFNRMFPNEVYDLFEGEQLVVVGRYRQPGQAKVTIAGHVQGQQQSFDFPAEFTAKSGDESYAFVEKLWAMRRIGDIIDELDLSGHNDELVKELVELSTRHGILTPYTSFLADETTDIRELAGNAVRARRELEVLDEAEGESGFSQRAEKQRLRAATSGPAGAARPEQPGEERDAALAGQAGGNATFRGTDDKLVVAEGVRNVGNKSFYLRGGEQRWVDSTVTEEMEQNAQRVTQYSDDYFKLAAAHGKRLSQYLVIDEPLLLNLDGQAYFIDPPGGE